MNQNKVIDELQSIQSRLYRIARRILVSHEESQDCVQDVILKIIERKEIAKQAKNIEAYAITMVRNQGMDRLKSKQAGFLRIEEGLLEDVISAEEELDETFSSVQRLRKVDDAVQHLPEKQRLVWQLRDVEGYDFEEIESIMDMNASAVRVTLSRARKAIRTQILGENENKS
ncbi:MAG: sigma-70 family RNA polymerase sigma factor [Flavobacteriaceae bacterium]